MILFLCLLVLGLGRCQGNDLPSRSEIENSINRTIEEVERKIREDPKLPRLSRQQIVSILQNITTEDLKTYKDKAKIEVARKMYQRALMLVLPYNGENEDLNDLYTKPPMTQIIPDFAKEGIKELGDEKKGTSKGKKKNERPANSAENNVNRGSQKNQKDNQTTTVKSRYKNHRETYSEVHTKVPLKETLKLDSAPMKFTFNLDNLQKNLYPAEKSTAKSPVYQSPEEKDRKPDLEIVYGTSTSTESVKTDSKEITIDLEQPKQESKSTQNILSSNQWRYNAPPSTTAKTSPKTTTSRGSNKRKETSGFLPTTIRIKPEDGVTVSSTERSWDTMEILKEKSTVRPAPLYVTPMPTEAPKTKYSSTYTLTSGGFRTETTSSVPMRPEVMDLLASIGLRPDNQSNVEDLYKKNKEILENKFQIPDTNSVFHTTTSGLTSVDSESASIVNQNTFESPGSDLKKGMDNLSPDVQLLFQRFGLQTSNLGHTSTTTPRTTVNLNSYTNFKPLPASNVKDKEMREFLARFGLGVSDDRRPKSMSSPKPSLIEAVPSNMRNILENIGLISTRKAPTVLADMEPTETSQVHVFKPHEVNVQDKKHRSKINELLDTVRLVQEGKADIQNVRKVANDLLETTKTLRDGPDPLSLEEILRLYNEDVKNEVKRQQQETTTVSATEETNLTSSAATEPTSTTDSAKSVADPGTTSESVDSSTSTSASASANLVALEESFGGTTREPDPVLPARRKSGLYFLVDWNSFLEVGEEDKEKVNLRFQPKVGDRSRFLSVTVP